MERLLQLNQFLIMPTDRGLLCSLNNREELRSGQAVRACWQAMKEQPVAFLFHHFVAFTAQFFEVGSIQYRDAPPGSIRSPQASAACRPPR